MQVYKGLTLLELIIVMVILVTVAALSVPAAYRSFSAQRVNKAADLVRAELNRARVQSMRTGEVYGFFYYPGAQNFKVAPFNEEMVGVLNQTKIERNNVRPSNFDYGNELLPRGVTFVEGLSVDDSRSLLAESEFNAPSNVRPLLFYPDGSSQDAKLFLRSDQDHYVEIKLRGMTGTSSTSAVANISQIGRGR